MKGCESEETWGSFRVYFKFSSFFSSLFFPSHYFGSFQKYKMERAQWRVEVRIELEGFPGVAVFRFGVWASIVLDGDIHSFFLSFTSIPSFRVFFF